MGSGRVASRCLYLIVWPHPLRLLEDMFLNKQKESVNFLRRHQLTELGNIQVNSSLFTNSAARAGIPESASHAPQSLISNAVSAGVSNYIQTWGKKPCFHEDF